MRAAHRRRQEDRRAVGTTDGQGRHATRSSARPRKPATCSRTSSRPSSRARSTSSRTAASPSRAARTSTPRQALEREVIVAAIERKRGAGMNAGRRRRRLPPRRRVHDPQPLRGAQDARGARARAGVRRRGASSRPASRSSRAWRPASRCCPTRGLPPLPREPVRRDLQEVKVLFDRRDPAGVLWPRRQAFETLLDIAQRPELDGVWDEDETIGWVYQYFNGADERKKMRDESQAPRNSRELAVRNQFFTPRYVVQFLDDNTLGRTWVEMHGEGHAAHSSPASTSCGRSTSRSGRGPEGSARPADPRPRLRLRPLPPLLVRPPPRDLRGGVGGRRRSSARAASRAERSARTTRTSTQLREALPALIVEHNLYGVDIDARCAQIAALALWLRAQRAYQDLGIRGRSATAHPAHAHRGRRADARRPGARGRLRRRARAAVAQRRCSSGWSRRCGSPASSGRCSRSSCRSRTTSARRAEQFLAEQERPSLFPELRPKVEQGKLDLSGVTDETVFQDAEETHPRGASALRRVGRRCAMPAAASSPTMPRRASR